MKAKNLYVIALCAGAFAFSNVAQAQDVFVDDAATVTEFTCDNTDHYFSNWRNNWFIEISAGGNQPLTECGMAVPEVAIEPFNSKKWTAVYSVGVGRWINPELGIRLKGIYGAIHWDSPLNWQQAINNEGWSKMKHASLSFELMWDMLNTFRGVNSKRIFSLIPYIGIGGDCSWDYKGHDGNQPIASNVYKKGTNDLKEVQWTLPLSVGFEFRFRLCKYVDFFAEIRASVYGDNWNNYVTGYNFDGLFSTLGGFNFNIGGRDWKTFNECDYVNQIAALNGQVNDLRAQLVNCGQTVAALQAQLPCPEVVQKDCKNAPLMATVRFLINSSKILPTEEVSIYTMAEWLKANPDEKIIIAGYADKDTGTSEYNLKLSERRANAVKDALVNEYGIAADRLETKSFGSDVQEYPSHNDWNRIVIFKQ